MKVLITGITGMAGSHLAEYVFEHHDAEVYGTYRWRSRLDNLQGLADRGLLNIVEPGALREGPDISRYVKAGKVNLLECDIADATSMRLLIGAVRPERIFHLAAQSFVPASWTSPAETLQRNIIGEVHLLEAVREHKLDPLIQVAGSSEEYGLVLPEEVPIKETNPLRPLSPYAVSKVGQELLALQYFRSYGMRNVVTRGFNHTGPRRGHVFVTSNFAKQVAEIEKGLHPPVLEVGDLTSRRDFTDVRDFVRAYWLALEKGEPGEVYNIGSGVSRPIQELVDILLSLSKVKFTLQQDSARMRPSDVKILQADASKFRARTGWSPQIPFEQTMSDLLDYWRERV